MGKPHWLRKRLPSGSTYEGVRFALKKSRLQTVCQEAKCPNLWECFSCRTATFLIMGPHCTRNCRFCAVSRGQTVPLDPEEPSRVAEAARSLGLTYVVVTSVTRDDLPDGGAGHFAKTIRAIRRRIPDADIEVLIPDFQGNTDSLKTVLDARPHVLNHNLETVRTLYPRVRPQAVYERSLEVLSTTRAYDSAIRTKTGLMLGLGERDDEVGGALDDVLDSGCSILTLGQYLQPTREHLAVHRFIEPDEFDRWKDRALGMGFLSVASGPFVRSSYRAKALYDGL